MTSEQWERMVELDLQRDLQSPSHGYHNAHMEAVLALIPADKREMAIPLLCHIFNDGMDQAYYEETSEGPYLESFPS